LIEFRDDGLPGIFGCTTEETGMNDENAAGKPSKEAKSPVLNLAAKSIKVTLVIDPAQLRGVSVPNGATQVPFVIDAGGRKVRGRFNAKTLRRSAAVVAELGAASLAVIIQGRLGAGDQIEDAGIAAQPKAPRNG
jgi:hypothetical protein